MPVVPTYDADRRTNFLVDIGHTTLAVGIVYPFNFDADEARRGICGGDATLIDSAYIVLGVGEGRTRPSASSIDTARANPLGGLRASTSAIGLLRAVYRREFWDAFEAGELAQLITERLVR
jgi:hypothetical protein